MDFIGEHHIPRDLTQGIGSTDVGNVTQHFRLPSFISVWAKAWEPIQQHLRTLQEEKQEDVLSLQQ